MAAADFTARTVFTYITAVVDDKLLAAVDAIVNRATITAGELVLAFGTIIIAFYGLGIALGWYQHPAQGFAKLVAKLAFFSAIVSGSVYAYWVRDAVLVALPDLWGQVVSAATGVATNASAYDRVFDDTVSAGFAIWRELGTYNPLKLLVGIYFLVAGAGILAGYGIWLMAHIAAAVYVSIGAVFLPLGLFAATRGIFSAWIGVTLSTVVLQGLSLALTSLLIGAEGGIAHAILAGGPDETYGRVGMLLAAMLVFTLCGWFASKLPSAAAALCGGVHYAPSLLIDATYGTVGRGAAAVAGAAGRGAGVVAGAARRGLSGPASMPAPGPSLSRTPVAQGTSP